MVLMLRQRPISHVKIIRAYREHRGLVLVVIINVLVAAAVFWIRLRDSCKGKGCLSINVCFNACSIS